MSFIQNIDLDILNFIQNNIRSSFLDNIVPIITKLGNVGIIWIVIAIILLFMKKYRKVGVLMLIALIFTHLIGTVIIKNIVRRPRPFTLMNNFQLLIKKPGEFSFPSGHSSTAFASATILGYYIKKMRIPIFILAFLIAFSRLYLFVHYPSDVLVGAILGIICSFIVIKIYNKKFNYINEC